MGMYTEIVVRANLKKDIPGGVRAVLRFLTGKDNTDLRDDEIPDHPFFRTTRWRYTLISSSYYHLPQNITELWYDPIAESYYLFVRSDLKNYDNEIELFFDWIDPYIDASTGEWIGHKFYEEDKAPTPVYKQLPRR